MRLDKFTTKFQEALSDAQSIALGHDNAYIEPVHLLVAVTSAHRGQSFQACEFLMDYLKTQAPFWKKEQTPQGARWVDARVSDDAALARWGITASNA